MKKLTVMLASVGFTVMVAFADCGLPSGSCHFYEFGGTPNPLDPAGGNYVSFYCHGSLDYVAGESGSGRYFAGGTCGTTYAGPLPLFIVTCGSTYNGVCA